MGVATDWNGDLEDLLPAFPAPQRSACAAPHTWRGSWRRVLRGIGWLAVLACGLSGWAAALLGSVWAIDDRWGSADTDLLLLASALGVILLAAGATVLWTLLRGNQPRPVSAYFLFGEPEGN